MSDPAADEPDVIDTLAGIAPGSPLDAIRRGKPVTRDGAQASFLALFRPAETDAMTLAERLGLAVFVAGLHRRDAEAAFYAERLRALPDGSALAEAAAAAAAASPAEGPAGRFPAGPLSLEDTPAPAFPAGMGADAGPRLAAAFAHAHLLVFRPREADPDALARLVAAGWTTTGIVTLSQLVAFLAFQLRVVAGLRALQDA